MIYMLFLWVMKYTVAKQSLTPRGAGGGGRFGPPSSFLQITRKNLKLTTLKLHDFS